MRSKLMEFCVVLPLSDGDAELDGLFVEPTFWHQGIGKQLVQIALDDLHIKGKASLQVLANPQSERFYTRYLSRCLFVGCTRSPRSHS
ncbi:GNAT family N-acetyltransferase [Photorhabdus sp. CRCIA-P01]|uniref:GNAT family N-acetyltransferase n=1 Tax=Photorhabdus sp. CRCIA-P01 TaxID=2019570 RepID=UPI00130078F7|nr:GNAT family N-acetyltransferase [Photorhabdus sp. CRCIA-P01]